MKKFLTALWFCIFAVIAVRSQDSQNSEIKASIVEEIRAHQSGIAVWWTGHNGWLVKSDSILIATDLVLDS